MKEREFKSLSFGEISERVKREIEEAGYDLEMIRKNLKSNDLGLCFLPGADAEEVRMHDMEEYRKNVDPDADEWDKIAQGYEQIPSGTIWMLMWWE